MYKLANLRRKETMSCPVAFPRQSLSLAADTQCLSEKANESAQRIGAIAFAIIGVGVAAYLVKCGFSEHTCALFSDSSDIWSNLHDILGLFS